MTRPTLRGDVRTGAGTWLPVPFLVDSGADRTVLSGTVLRSVQLQPRAPTDAVVGVGGRADTVVIDTEFRFPREEGSPITFRGEFAAFTDPASLDMCVLGRDITNFFAAIIDRPGNTVVLVRPPHRYCIEETP